MKIVLLNAATLPIYCEELAALMLDAQNHNLTSGYRLADTPEQHQDALDYFHTLRGRISRSEILLWIARGEQGVAGSVQLNIGHNTDIPERADIQHLLVHSSARRKGTGRKLIRALESKAWESRCGLIYLDLLAGSTAEVFCQAQGYRTVTSLSQPVPRRQTGSSSFVTYYKRLLTDVSALSDSTY